MKKKWLIKEAPDLQQVQKLKNELKLEEVIAYLLIQRGITDYENMRVFFRGTLQELHDPFLMLHMKEAVQRVNKALLDKEKILIYGDYDVDGTTAVTMMYSFLSKHTSNLDYYIPDRYKEGYGVSEQGIHFAKDNGFSLIITLDCGIKANEQADLAKSLGIDMIVCDHHTPGEVLPAAIVLDPKQKNCEYPYKELSGCGVGFKLLQALSMENKWDMKELFSYLDLLAISIGADIVPVTGENRLLAQHGLKTLNQNTRLSIDWMLKLAKKEKPLTLTDVVFTIAPRINAAGRLEDAKSVVELLSSNDEEKIKDIAQKIQDLNDERRSLDKATTQEALEIIKEQKDFEKKVTTVVYKEDWHKGVIGIVASRLIENYYRPTIVLTQSEDGNFWTGSARSIDEINIYEVLNKCKETLEQFGGHFHAAGLTLTAKNLPRFLEKFEQEVSKIVGDDDLIEEQLIERELKFNELFTMGESVTQIPRLMRVLSQFEPYGPDNMRPLFLAKNVYARNIKILKDEHLKMEVFQPDFQKPIDAIFFNNSSIYEAIRDTPFDMVFTLEENQFRGRSTPQLMIKDIRPLL
ncbi:MAG: single-stranded-DNA-specific exonuclease RecJ [Brumimicrobium sp.]|nr:single-stranded-DNA-specific exonuclease RecJ [Brumimicrobium sp.]